MKYMFSLFICILVFCLLSLIMFIYEHNSEDDD